MEKKAEILWNLAEIKVLKISEKYPPKDFDTENTISHTIHFGHKLSVEDNQFGILIKIIGHTFEESELTEKKLKDDFLFECEIEHLFDIKNLETLKKDENTCNLPDGLIYTFFTIAISDVRGILYSKLSHEVYKNSYLPLIGQDKIMEIIHSANKIETDDKPDT